MLKATSTNTTQTFEKKSLDSSNTSSSQGHHGKDVMLEQHIHQPMMEKKSDKELNETRELMKTLKLYSGQTFEEISQKHRVIIFTIKFFGCPLCQETLEFVSQQILPMLQLNTIPVIGIQEDPYKFAGYLKNSKDPILPHLLFCKIEKSTRRVLGIGNASLVNHVKTLPKNLNAVLYEKRFLSIPSSLVAPLTAFGVFVIENSQVTRKIIYGDLTKRVNFGVFLQDMKAYSGIGGGLDHNIFEDLLELYPGIGLNEIRRASRRIAESVVDLESRNEESIINELHDVLNDDAKRYYFKAFAINEYSPEAINFFEEVRAYSHLQEENQRKILAQSIHMMYLQEKSFSLINTTKSLISEVETQMDDNKYPLDLYSPILKDLIISTLMDTFFRFKKDKLYSEMKSEKKSVLSYLC